MTKKIQSYNEKTAREWGFIEGMERGPLAGFDPSSTEFIERCKEVQAQIGLKADGWFGPKSLSKYVAEFGAPFDPQGVMIIDGKRHSVSSDLKLRTWWGEVRDTPRNEPVATVERLVSVDKAGRKRTRLQAPTEIVFHEPVTKSFASTQRVLGKKNLGVHFMVGPYDEHVGQHADPLSDIVYHMPEHNTPSIGIEVCNPYEPKHSIDPWTQAIDAKWAYKDKYLLPTLSQSIAVCHLVVEIFSKFEIPKIWHAADQEEGVFYMDKLPGTSAKFHKAKPGVWAHLHIGGHSDGAFPCLVAYLHVIEGLSPRDAHFEAVTRVKKAFRHKGEWVVSIATKVELP